MADGPIDPDCNSLTTTDATDGKNIVPLNCFNPEQMLGVENDSDSMFSGRSGIRTSDVREDMPVFKTGIESDVSANSSFGCSNSARHAGTQVGTRDCPCVASFDAELQRVVQAWQELTDAGRAEILRIVKSEFIK